MPDLTPEQWALVVVIGAIVVIVPDFLKSRRSKRLAKALGYRPQTQGIHTPAVMFGLVKLTALLLIWSVVSSALATVYQRHLPAKLMEVGWMIAGIVDMGALAMAVMIALPESYTTYMMNKPKSVHAPIDWLVGIVLTIVFMPAWLLHIIYFAGLGAN